MRSLVLLAALASSAAAQHVLVHESFENGLAGWTATGLWNAESATDFCGTGQAPFPDGTGLAYYGIDGQCHFDTGGTNSGSLTRNGWVQLPVGAGSISLRFWSRSETESCTEDWDIHRVFLLVDDVGTAVPLVYCDGTAVSSHQPWHERRFDVTPWAGHDVSVRFSFDTVDAQQNDLLGWMLDDVSIEVEPGVRICPDAGLISGCPCTAPSQPSWHQAPPVAGGCRNSTHQSAVLISSGLPSVGADSLRIAARNMPPNAACILVQHETATASVVFGDGIRCVGGPLRRLGALVASGGAASWPPPGADPISVRGAVPGVGGARYYHAYYRDVLPYCTPSAFNVTDVQRITWTP